MDFGTERSVITTYRNGDIAKSIKHYRIRIKVNSSQEEMAEFIRFTTQLVELKDKLTFDKEDPTTRPAFIIEFPKENIDGSYFIIKSYCVNV